MSKVYSPDSSPEELAEFFEVMKSTASFLNNNPKAKALMDDPSTKLLSEEEFVKKLMMIAAEVDAPNGNMC